MAILGLVITLFGFVIAVGSLGMTSSHTVQLILVLAGILVSLAGIMGVLNQAYMKDAIWKK
jgi:cytochrome c biogenesis protein CcdA